MYWSHGGRQLRFPEKAAPDPADLVDGDGGSAAPVPSGSFCGAAEIQPSGLVPAVVFLTDAPVAADRAVALSRDAPVPAVKKMVREVEGRESREAGQDGEPDDLACFHHSLLFSMAARFQFPTPIRSILKTTVSSRTVPLTLRSIRWISLPLKKDGAARRIGMLETRPES